tara:strand:- start:5670 stop:6044 length:375 start_codon:yes stop_codon:yes gene_type:complete
MDIKLYRLSYEDGEYCVGTEAEVISRHNEWVKESGRFELDEIDNNLTTTIEDKTLHEHWTVEHFYTVSIKEVEDKLQNATEAAQQLWLCLRRGYRYDEAQIHMKAFREGKTTMKRVVVEDKGGE